MVQVGQYNDLTVRREVSIGVYLDGSEDGILLPKRFVPPGIKAGDTIRVFIYHDSENRLIATTQKPYAVVGEIAMLEAVSSTQQGAFLDWGLMKDLFVPRSKQLMGMLKGGRYLVLLYIDEQTGRIAATEKFDWYLQNDELTVKEMELVKLMAYRRTDLGYVMIINDRHTGLLHFNEIYRNIEVGDVNQGYVKKIYEDNRIDVVLGRPGYQRVEDETGKILRLLEENNDYLPYHDKSDPEEIYEFFGMSKKTFKMAVGKLYKEKKIELTKTGLKKL
jgi:uncharacterized protein